MFYLYLFFLILFSLFFFIINVCMILKYSNLSNEFYCNKIFYYLIFTIYYLEINLSNDKFNSFIFINYLQYSLNLDYFFLLIN